MDNDFEKIMAIVYQLKHYREMLKEKNLELKGKQEKRDIEQHRRFIEDEMINQTKIQKFSARLLYDLVNLHPTSTYKDHDKVMKQRWEKFNSL